LAAGLVDVMHTDLGELAPGQCLADFKPSDRLAELDFEMRMAPSSSMSNTVGALAQALSDRSLVPENDPLASYGRVLATSPAASTVLSGYLTGSIDAVLRRPDGRFLVIDYKTNRAPRPAGQPLEPRAYDVTTMTSMMISSHYPLQALLYSAALHRYLSHTMPGYDPATCLGPVGYLFVRAMAGVATPADASMPNGVFTWSVNPALVVAVSDILRGRHEH
ncbi:MAG: exodeoxyribonuclease V subunit beta, partial [Cutibacterium granulosum]